MTPEQLREDISAYAAAESGRTAARMRHAVLRRQADQEQTALMATEVDSYLDAMRPAFNQAAAEARAVIGRGVEPDDTAERAMARGGAAAELWISFKAGSGSVATLERISDIRARLAEVTGAGEGPGADHCIGVLDTFTPGALATVRGEPAYRKWLRQAKHLELIPFAELDSSDVLKAQGHDLDELLSVAPAPQ
ncbi:hypothetical protein AHiyo4_07670 [Arthrobacter sp. Hiyo4]|nr:hypothetical protein AHiyo4_07670 [Arthrobacter sp. Hiyo4]